MNIKELAKKLNLSITTVSRGLADYSDVSEKTKKRIKNLLKNIIIILILMLQIWHHEAPRTLDSFCHYMG